MSLHSLDLDKDEEGWSISACSCGWISPSCPDDETAAEFFTDHVVVIRLRLEEKILHREVT